MLQIIAFRGPLLIWFFTIAACSKYSISINENEIYSPKPIFTQFSLKDSALQTCVDTIIAEKKLTSAEQVTQIMCNANNIANLEGIEIFTNLERIGLKNNKVTSVSTLPKLKKIKQIDLSGNPIQSVMPLAQLTKLIYLDISGTTTISCNEISRLKNALPKAMIVTPINCVASPSKP